MKALQRVGTFRCSSCRSEVASEVSRGKYLAFFIYAHLIIPPVGVVLNLTADLYRQARAWVVHVVKSGNPTICGDYPESIDRYLYLSYLNVRAHMQANTDRW